MAYVLDSVSIPRPTAGEERNSTQVAQVRTLSGRIARDYFGSNKRVWTYEYRDKLKADYDTINTIYQSYLSTGTAKTWEVTETNYTVSATTVHVDLLEREFSVRGDTYLSNFDLILTEA